MVRMSTTSGVPLRAPMVRQAPASWSSPVSRTGASFSSLSTYTATRPGGAGRGRLHLRPAAHRTTSHTVVRSAFGCGVVTRRRIPLVIPRRVRVSAAAAYLDIERHDHARPILVVELVTSSRLSSSLAIDRPAGQQVASRALFARLSGPNRTSVLIAGCGSRTIGTRGRGDSHGCRQGVDELSTNASADRDGTSDSARYVPCSPS